MLIRWILIPIIALFLNSCIVYNHKLEAIKYHEELDLSNEINSVFSYSRPIDQGRFVNSRLLDVSDSMFLKVLNFQGDTLKVGKKVIDNIKLGSSLTLNLDSSEIGKRIVVIYFEEDKRIRKAGRIKGFDSNKLIIINGKREFGIEYANIYSAKYDVNIGFTFIVNTPLTIPLLITIILLQWSGYLQ